jgi:hypothetical protein
MSEAEGALKGLKATPRENRGIVWGEERVLVVIEVGS